MGTVSILITGLCLAQVQADQVNINCPKHGLHEMRLIVPAAQIEAPTAYDADWFAGPDGADYAVFDVTKSPFDIAFRDKNDSPFKEEFMKPRLSRLMTTQDGEATVKSSLSWKFVAKITEGEATTRGPIGCITSPVAGDRDIDENVVWRHDAEIVVITYDALKTPLRVRVKDGALNMALSNDVKAVSSGAVGGVFDHWKKPGIWKGDKFAPPPACENQQSKNAKILTSRPICNLLLMP